MANPIAIDCPVTVWTLLATDIISGTFKILEPRAGYHFAYRMTGSPAPLDADVADTQRCDESAAIVHSAFSVDIYCWCPSGTPGRVQVEV